VRNENGKYEVKEAKSPEEIEEEIER